MSRLFFYLYLYKEPIMFGKGGLGGLMKQAQQMQEKMQKMQEEIAQVTILIVVWDKSPFKQNPTLCKQALYLKT